MNYNIFSTADLVIPNDEINSRAKLDTGTNCNYECYFCYYIEQLHVTTDLDTIKNRALKIKNFGIKQIDLSGGESSIHKNWFEILDYCKELRFENISCLTNGFKFADFEFFKKSKEHGLSEILISLHGFNEENHDSIVKRKGAFKKILTTIENAKKLGITIRINCTVTSENVAGLDQYASLINNLSPAQVNFLPLNYWGQANKLNIEKYEVLSSGTKKAINLINKNIEINVRYIPFCFMEGYESHVVGIFQHIFDKRDWNILAYDIDNLDGKKNKISYYFDLAKNQRLQTYFKPQKCFKCKYFNICDGIEHQLKDSQEVYLVPGEKIKDVQFFRRNL